MKLLIGNGDTIYRDETLKNYICALLDEKPEKIYDILQEVSTNQEKAFIEMLKQDLEGRVNRLLEERVSNVNSNTN